jgi:hypothetical protein
MRDFLHHFAFQHPWWLLSLLLIPPLLFLRNVRGSEFGIDFPIIKDEGQALAKALGVERTAEVFIVNPRTRKVLYRGPINDQLGYETQRNNASEHYLKDALDTVLTGAKVDMNNIPDSKGCLIAIFDT